MMDGQAPPFTPEQEARIREIVADALVDVMQTYFAQALVSAQRTIAQRALPTGGDSDA